MLSNFLTAWQTATNANQPVLLLGQGSNVLFTDDFHGVVLINKMQGIEQHEDADFHYLHVQGGTELARVSENSALAWHLWLRKFSLNSRCGGLCTDSKYRCIWRGVCEMCAIFVDVVHLPTG